MKSSVRLLWITLGIATAAVAGCAGSMNLDGRRLLRQGNYTMAISLLEADEARHPESAAVKRDLGAALLESGQADDAFRKLSEARSLNPRDARTLFHLGRAAEAIHRSDAALDAYGNYLIQAKPTPAERALVQARIEAISRQKATADIQAAIVQEESLRPIEIPENSIAVPDFRNVAESDTLAPLSRGLAAMVVTDLSKVKQLRVLERQRIQILLHELDLAQAAAPPPKTNAPDEAGFADIASPLGLKQRLAVIVDPLGLTYFDGTLDETNDENLRIAIVRFQKDHHLTADGVPGRQTLEAVRGELAKLAAARTAKPNPPAGTVGGGEIDPATAPRAGQLLRARRFVQGSFIPVGPENIKLDADLIAVPEGSPTSAGDGVAGPLREVLRLEKNLVYQILSALRITPEPDERKEIDRLPTRSFLAFLAYSRGLDLEERGIPAEATGQYQEALRLDPGFSAARARVEILSVTPEGQRTLDRAELLRTSRSGQTPGSRLTRTASANGLGPGVDSDRAEDTDPSSPPIDRLGPPTVEAEIVIEGDIPQGAAGGLRP